MSSALTELAIVAALTVANGIFSMSEMAIVSSRKTRLQNRAERGDRAARAALALAESPNQFLSTIQIGITLIGILTGTFGGASLSAELRPILEAVPPLAPMSGALSVVITVAGITYLSLVVGELVPKRLALGNPEQIAANVALPMRWLSWITAPVVYLLSHSTDLIVRSLGTTVSSEPQVTEEEIKLLLQQGTEAGTVEEAEQEIVERVLSLGDRPVSSVMTSRREVVWLDLDAPLHETIEQIINSHHQRFPVCRDSLDEVVGFIQVNDLLAQTLMNQTLNLTDCLRQPLIVPETTGTLRILEMFRETGLHIALVVDEYGVVQGLVTINDMLEAIVGDLTDVDEEDTPKVVQREDGSWLVDGMLAIERMRDELDMAELPGEREGRYQTVAGFVIASLGHIPKATDTFHWNGFRFEVVDMDGNRVDKILVSKPSTAPSTSEPPTAD
ncbi:MAG: hemolysin family protein [Limnothrix sp. BL-A-16]